MRRWISFAFIVCLVLSGGCATPPPKRAYPVADIPSEVGAEFQASIDGWNAGNLDAFLAIYADSATFALADDYLQGRAAIREFYMHNFQPGAVRDQLTLERLDVEVLSPEAALVRGIYRNTRKGEVTRRGTTTLVLRRIMGRWQIVHDHSN
jgi:uncharacterized protein (TIGR02246 family)